MRPDTPSILATTEALARIESPSDDAAAVTRCAAELARRCEGLGGRVERHAAPGAGDHVRATFGSGSVRILLLGHTDTVWPVGTLEAMPVVRKEGRLYGPGVFDMKAGLAIALEAIRLLQAAGALAAEVVLLATSDEEVGSATSRALIEDDARLASAVLVLEPALPNGGVKTGRKGVGEFRIELEGIASHAGLDPAGGASAIRELARQTMALEALADPSRGTTINVGVVGGGTRSNVVAAEAWALVDVRVTSLEEATRIEAAMALRQAADPRVRIRVTGGVNRPPMERSPAVLRLYEEARQVALELGHVLAEGEVGGASDGNLTAALGIPTLDGLGAVGDGAHARHEHIDVAASSFRAALLAGLIRRLGRSGPCR